VRLKLSSTRASQAGLKEMMMQMKNEGLKVSNNKKTRHFWISPWWGGQLMY